MSPHQTAAMVVTEHGGPDVLQVRQRPVAEPGPGQLLVRVAAAGVNFVDIYQREGVYPVPTPYVLGNEGAGTVEAIGTGVRQAGIGDRVAWSQTLGSAAGLALIPESDTVPVPDSVSDEDAAAVLLQGMTAHYLLNSTYPVQPGDAVLVHAAAGGVGQLLVQLARAKGALVIATTSTAAKAAKARALGAQHVLDYTDIDDLAAAVRELTGGVGVAAVYDGVGKTTFDASLRSLRPRGTLALFGAASGQVPPVDLQRLNAGGSLFVTRPSLGHYIASRDELLLRGNEILAAVGDGRLRVEIGGRYPLADAGQAYADLTGRRSTGKLLLIP
ncbi:MAG: quinone oxidoreductase family protein [Jatrophihabitans sp.]